jgi:hypothetical protein
VRMMTVGPTSLARSDFVNLRRPSPMALDDSIADLYKKMTVLGLR